MTAVRPIHARSSAPQTGVWWGTDINFPIGANTGVNVTRSSSQIEIAGYRRYRLKVRHSSTWQWSVSDRQLARFVDFETTVIGTGGPGTHAYNFGEGTGLLECLSGGWIIVRGKNLGPSSGAVQDLELWLQS
jgi:hypothetical protein